MYSELPQMKQQKLTLVHAIIQKMNKKYLFGWNYCVGTSNYREAVYWGSEIAAGIALLVAIAMDDLQYKTIALIYFIKHLLLSLDYLYLVVRREILPIEVLTNLNNVQFWVVER